MATFADIHPVPRFTEMPKCVWRPSVGLRIYRETLPDGTTKDTLEMAYVDGWENPFWGPVPIVKAD